MQNSQTMIADTDKGMIVFSSPWSFAATIARIEKVVADKKIKVFARIDQAAEAQAVGLALRPTALLIFCDPNNGTPLMDAHPTLAIDLLLKALAWEAGPSEIFIGLTSSEFLQNRHGPANAPFAKVVRLFSGLIENGSKSEVA